MPGFLGMPGVRKFTTTSGSLENNSDRNWEIWRVYDVVLIAGAGGASTIKLRNGISTGGTLQIQLDADASKCTTWTSPNGIVFPDGCYVEVDGNTAALTVSCAEEL